MCDGCPPGKSSQLVDDRIQGLLRRVGITAMFPGLVTSLAATLNAPDEKPNPSSMLVSRVLASDRREPVGYKHAAPPHSASASDRWPWTMITKYKSSAFVSLLPRTCGRRWRQVSRRSTPRTRMRTVARMSRALGPRRGGRARRGGEYRRYGAAVRRWDTNVAHLGPPRDPYLPPAERARRQRRSAWSL